MEQAYIPQNENEQRARYACDFNGDESWRRMGKRVFKGDGEPCRACVGGLLDTLALPVPVDVKCRARIDW